MTNIETDSASFPPPQRPILERVFVSSDEPRLRAGWRLLLQTVLLLIVSFFIGFLAEFAIQLGQSEFLFSFLYVLAITLSVYMPRRFLDRRSFVSLGLGLEWWALWDILVGFGIAGLIMGLIYLLEWAFGWLIFLGYTWEFLPASQVVQPALTMLLVYVFVGWQEELVSRGYQLQNLIDGLNVPWAVFLSAAIYGLLRIDGSNASLISMLNLLAVGIFYAYAYLRTRRLWLPIGLHIGWNFFQGSVFGFPISGVDDYSKLIHQSVAGPELFTGGSLGPETGLILLPGLVLGVALVAAYSRLAPYNKPQ